MKFHENIIEDAKNNSYFRKVLVTGRNSQIVLMSIPPKNEIGEEVHGSTDQISFFVEGKGQSIIEGEKSETEEGDLIFIPAGAAHNIKNTGKGDLKLFSIYAPPEHQPGTLQKVKEELISSTEKGKMAYQTKEKSEVANWNID